MARPRKPLEINRKHFTKAEIEQRKAETLEVPFTDVVPPNYLNAKQKREFVAIADQLLKLNILTELDVDILAQYCIAKELYLEYSDQLKKVLAKRNAVHKWGVVESIATTCEEQQELVELLEAILRRQRGDDATVLMNLQDKAFKQCLACAKELGLTITSRCRIVIPPPPDDSDDEL